MASDWTALAEAVKARRVELRLPQNLIRYGGPGAMTMRKIERGEVEALRGDTKSRLEIALAWPRLHVDQILDHPADPSAPVDIPLPAEPPRDRRIEAVDADGVVKRSWTWDGRNNWVAHEYWGVLKQDWIAIQYYALAERLTLRHVPAEGSES